MGQSGARIRVNVLHFTLGERHIEINAQEEFFYQRHSMNLDAHLGMRTAPPEDFFFSLLLYSITKEAALAQKLVHFCIVYRGGKQLIPLKKLALKMGRRIYPPHPDEVS